MNYHTSHCFLVLSDDDVLSPPSPCVKEDSLGVVMYCQLLMTLQHLSDVKSLQPNLPDLYKHETIIISVISCTPTRSYGCDRV